jgi:predicted Zn-dependent protease
VETTAATGAEAEEAGEAVEAPAGDSRSMLARAEAVAPRHPVVLVARSDLALAQGRPMEAMTLRRQLAWRFPTAWEHWYLTADAALAAGYCPEVGRSLERLRELNPDFEELPDLVQRAAKAGCARP